MRKPILGTNVGEFADILSSMGWKPYYAQSIYRWIMDRRVENFEAMSDLPKRLRQELSESWTVFATSVDLLHQSPDGTTKLLLCCEDQQRIECVLMAEDDRRTVCISTQVGCGMRCVFCASGLKGVVRNLSRAELIEQIIRLRNLLPADENLTNVVVMGMGESLANLDNLVSALDWICSPEGLRLGQRRVTISTVGLPDKIRTLAELNRQYHLAVSLHAPTEALRNELVPINEKVGLTAVVEAADYYFETTGRQVTYEYVMLHGVNDRNEDAAHLAALLRSRKSHVNLIPYNPIVGLPYERPTPEAIRHFTQVVRRGGVSVSVRKTKGRPIDAACGQLRRDREDTLVSLR